MNICEWHHEYLITVTAASEWQSDFFDPAIGRFIYLLEFFTEHHRTLDIDGSIKGTVAIFGNVCVLFFLTSFSNDSG